MTTKRAPRLPKKAVTAPASPPKEATPPRTPFGKWLQTCGMTPTQVAVALETSLSSVYNARAAYFRPGRRLAIAIAQLTTDEQTGVCAVPVEAWDETKLRRKAKARKRAV